MNTNYSLLFYLKKPKNYVNGPKPIYMRITVAGIPRELSAGRECDPARWNPMSNRVKGQKEEIRNLNAHLDMFYSSAFSNCETTCFAIGNSYYLTEVICCY